MSSSIARHRDPLRPHLLRVGGCTHSRALVMALGLLPACAASDHETTTGSKGLPGAAAAQVASGMDPAIASLAPNIGEVTHAGTLCAGKSPVARHPGFFQLYTGDRALEDGSTSAHCTVTAELEIPAGYALDGASVCAQFYLTHPYDPEGAVTADVTLRASIPGAASRPIVRQLVGVGDEPAQACVSLQDMWTPCGEVSGAEAVPVTIEVSTEAGPEALVQLTDVSADFTYQSGARWKSCPGAGTRLPSPSALGGACGGPNDHGCAPDLTCKRLDESAFWLLGQCSTD